MCLIFRRYSAEYDDRHEMIPASSSILIARFTDAIETPATLLSVSFDFQVVSLSPIARTIESKTDLQLPQNGELSTARNR